MAVKLAGGSSTSGQANVTSTFDLQVRTPATESAAGFVQVSSEVDAGTLIAGGARTLRALDSSPDYRLRVGIDQPLFDMSFEGTVVAQDRFSQVLSNFTNSQAGGFLVLNTAGTATAGHSVLRTYRTFPLFGSYPTYLDVWAKLENPTGSLIATEFGLGYALTTAAPTDGVFFRMTHTGDFQGVVSFAGAETPVTLSQTQLLGDVNHFLIVVHNDRVEFWVDDVMLGKIDLPANQAGPTASYEQPFYARLYQASAGTSSPVRKLHIGKVSVSIGDAAMNKPWAHTMVGMGGGSYQIQPGTASGPTVTRGTGATGWPTSATARIAGTWTATSAPALNSLGGLFTTPAMSTLVSDSDYPVFSYLNPAGTNALPGKTLYVTSIRVGEGYANAAASTNAMLLTYIVGVGSTTSATTATEGAIVVAARGTVVGAHGFTATAALGSVQPGFEVKFNSPLVVPAGTYFHFICRPFGTVTSNTLVVSSSLAVNGYFE